MNCPRCALKLETKTLRDSRTSVEVETCPGCSGSWFEKDELAHVHKLAEPVFVEIRRIPRTETQLKALYCPACENKPRMQKAEHPRDSKVIMDYCEQCKGVWLDGGELKAIQQENWLITMASILRWLFGIDD
jgi:Zn-finger nucleic acid-binding protein